MNRLIELKSNEIDAVSGGMKNGAEGGGFDVIIVRRFPLGVRIFMIASSAMAIAGMALSFAVMFGPEPENNSCNEISLKCAGKKVGATLAYIIKSPAEYAIKVLGKFQEFFQGIAEGYQETSVD